MKGTNELYVIEWEKHQKECNYTTHRQQISNYHHHHCCSAAGAGSSHNKQSPPSPTINHSSHSIHTINDQYNNELSDIIEFIDKHTKPNQTHPTTPPPPLTPIPSINEPYSAESTIPSALSSDSAALSSSPTVHGRTVVQTEQGCLITPQDHTGGFVEW